MRIKNHLFFAAFAVILATGGAHASTVYSAGTQPMSKYGQIQNVQTYSSNPFWTPNSPYNQRMPQPVYAQGPGVTTSDCQNTVSNLIAAECGLRNNCVGVRLSDIRPTIMTRLSRLPGHNYASSCAGYIDSVFNQYVSDNAIANGRTGTALPTATVPNPNVNKQNQQFKIQNPYEDKKPIWNNEPWAQEIKDRKNELEYLQSQNGVGSEGLVHADFPAAYADLSFAERMENEAAGFEPWKDAKAYLTMDIESEEDYVTRMANIQEDRRRLEYNTLGATAYCAKYPDDMKWCGTNASAATSSGSSGTTADANLRNSLVERIIGAFPK